MPEVVAQRKYLVLTAMIFAVAMMFIDQTIVAIAVPAIDRDLALSATGAQWIINGYLLALAALFALGGKLSDVLGHRRTVLAGIAGFALASALCGAAPSGSGGEAWLIFFRVVQGAFGALLFPAALAIVAASFDVSERGKALAIFFGITGGLTSVGPLTGGFLIEWTWRSIFWINVPVALIALALTLRSRPADERRDTTIDRRVELRVPALTGAGIGLVLSPASTDALNRAPRGSYGEVTGVTQTVRYFSSSLGLAILGTVFVNRIGGGAHVAQATQTVYRSMAGVMVACLLVAIIGMRPGRAGEA